MSVMGIRIREERKIRDLTQAELGEICGVTKYTISLYESGKSTPSDDIKLIFAKYFDVSVDYLLGVTDVKKYNTTLNEKDYPSREENQNKISHEISSFLINELITSGELIGKDDIDKLTMERIKRAILKDAENTKNKKGANH